MEIQQRIRMKLEETMPYEKMQSKLSYSEMEKIIEGFDFLIKDLLEQQKNKIIEEIKNY